MLTLNDEVFSRMTDEAFEGELVLGVPHDIVYPAIPQVLKLFKSEHPRMRLKLVSSYTFRLRRLFEDGQCDIILTTEEDAGEGGEIITTKPLLWYGAPGARAWQRRPIPLASEPHCTFRRPMQVALDQAGIPWSMAVDSDSSATVEATVSADFAVIAQLEGAAAPQLEPVAHGGALPDLGSFNINLYVSDVPKSSVLDDLAELVRRSYKGTPFALTA